MEIDEDHNLALITAHEPGADLETAVAAERHHLFHRRCLDAIYLDLPLENPATALLADHLERLGVSYAGVFPNNRTDGDVLRMQSLHRARISRRRHLRGLRPRPRTARLRAGRPSAPIQLKERHRTNVGYRATHGSR